MPALTVQHPLLEHKVGLARTAGLDSVAFRSLVREMAMLLAYEATRDLPLESVQVDTWSGPCTAKRLSGQEVTLVPILRAGLGMLDGVLSLIPNACVSMVGIQRNHETLAPEFYLERLANRLDQRTAIVLDPMLATGGSMIATVNLLKRAQALRIKALVLVAAPEGLQALARAHPDVDIHVAAIDSHLDANGYIVPGLGDAGDKLYGTTA